MRLDDCYAFLRGKARLLGIIQERSSTASDQTPVFHCAGVEVGCLLNLRVNKEAEEMRWVTHHKGVEFGQRELDVEDLLVDRKTSLLHLEAEGRLLNQVGGSWSG